VKKNLWGHALFLASKMDAKTHASILTRFSFFTAHTFIVVTRTVVMTYSFRIILHLVVHDCW